MRAVTANPSPATRVKAARKASAVETPWRGGLMIGVYVLTALLGYLGPLGFAPLVGLGGLLCLMGLRDVRPPQPVVWLDPAEVHSKRLVCNVATNEQVGGLPLNWDKLQIITAPRGPGCKRKFPNKGRGPRHWRRLLRELPGRRRSAHGMHHERSSSQDA